MTEVVFTILIGQYNFEFNWRQAADTRMNPLAIINLFDTVWDSFRDINEAFIFPQVHHLLFKGFHKRLSKGIVIGVATSGHADAKQVWIIR
jgi:hypothetical protein